MMQRVLSDDELKRWTPGGMLPETPEKPPAFEPFPIGLLPAPLSGFTREAAAAIGCDPSFVGVPLLSALGGCIGNSNVIELKRGWWEPAVIWSAIIGHSGSTKSPALDTVVRYLHRAQTDMVRAYQDALQQHAQHEATYEADYARWKTVGRGKGEPPPEKPVQPICQRVVVSDTTIEAVGVILDENPRGLLLSRDELAGFFGAQNQYKGGKGSDVPNWLSIHGAKPVIIDRKGSSAAARKMISIPRAAVSICGTIQPPILQQALGREHFQDGMAARFLLASPPPRAKRWTEAELSEKAEAEIGSLYERLLALEPAVDDRGESCPVVLTLTESGKAAWVTFYNEFAEEQASLEGDMAAAWSKLEGYAARLALVVHLVRREWFDLTLESPDAIDAVSVAAGVGLSRWFANEARRVYGLFVETDEERRVRELAEWIAKRGGTVTARELQHDNREYRVSADEADRCLDDLVKGGWGKWQPVPTSPQGGRPTRRFVLLGCRQSTEPQ